MSRLPTLLIVQAILLSTTALPLQRPAAKSTAQEVTLRADRLVLPTLDKVRRVLQGPDGNFYVLDNGNHRIAVFSPGWKFDHQISEVGQGPGELFEPYDFAIDRAGNVYVIDGRMRVQWLSPQGKFLGGFHYKAECLSIAVNGQGEILLSQPALGALVTVYGTDGSQRRSFGSLKAGGSDPRYQPVSNRVHLSVANDNSVYVSFDHLGLLQKYDPSGRLLWESSIPGDKVERMRQIFWSDSPDKSKLGIVLTTRETGVPAFYVAFNIFFDKAGGLLYVPLNDGSVYVADAAGKPVRLMKQPQGSVNFFNSVVVDNRGRLFASSVWSGVYLITTARAS